jgi:hypothetical protein
LANQGPVHYIDKETVVNFQIPRFISWIYILGAFLFDLLYTSSCLFNCALLVIFRSNAVSHMYLLLSMSTTTTAYIVQICTFVSAFRTNVVCKRIVIQRLVEIASLLCSIYVQIASDQNRFIHLFHVPLSLTTNLIITICS